MKKLRKLFCFFILLFFTFQIHAQNGRVWNRSKVSTAQLAIDSQIRDAFNKVPIEDLVIINKIKPFYTLDVKKTSELKTLQVSFIRHSRKQSLNYIGSTIIQYNDSRITEEPISKETFFIDDVNPDSYYDLLRLIRKETRRTYQLTNRSKYVTLQDLPDLIEDIQITPDYTTDKIYLSFFYKGEKITLPVSISSSVRNRFKELKKTQELFSELKRTEKKETLIQRQLDKEFAYCLKKYESAIRENASKKFIRGFDIINGCPLKWYYYGIFRRKKYVSSVDWYLVSKSSRRRFSKLYFDSKNNQLITKISTAYIIYHDLQLVSVVDPKKIKYYPNKNAELVLILENGKKAKCPLTDLYLNKNVQLKVTEEENNALEDQIEWIKND